MMPKIVGDFDTSKVTDRIIYIQKGRVGLAKCNELLGKIDDKP